jgi:biopolymer transport protein TolR
MKPIVQPAPTMASINLVPIIDVALVLVIILLVAAPMLVTTDIDIQLPEAVTRGAEDEVRVSITVGKSGEIAIEDDRIGPGQLDTALRARLSQVGDADILVVVRADEGVSHESVRRVLREARNAGAKRLAIATRQHGGGRS